MYKIMIIDDNHISVDGICHNIDWSDLNAEVACKAYDGQQALDYLQNNMVDLIISDIEMPQLDGLSLAQNALKINSSIKIILISAFDKFENWHTWPQSRLLMTNPTIITTMSMTMNTITTTMKRPKIGRASCRERV